MHDYQSVRWYICLISVSIALQKLNYEPKKLFYIDWNVGKPLKRLIGRASRNNVVNTCLVNRCIPLAWKYLPNEKRTHATQDDAVTCPNFNTNYPPRKTDLNSGRYVSVCLTITTPWKRMNPKTKHRTKTNKNPRKQEALSMLWKISTVDSYWPFTSLHYQLCRPVNSHS